SGPDARGGRGPRTPAAPRARREPDERPGRRGTPPHGLGRLDGDPGPYRQADANGRERERWVGWPTEGNACPTRGSPRRIQRCLAAKGRGGFRGGRPRALPALRLRGGRPGEGIRL